MAAAAAPANVLIFNEEALRAFTRSLLRAAGASAVHAGLVAETLVAANLRGVDSHGIQLLTMYLGRIQSGGIDLATEGKIHSESGACLVYDGEHGLGQVVADRCTDHAIRLVRDFGLALVTARNTYHFGAAAYWAEKMARSGAIGIVMCNAGPNVPPWQGAIPRLGTNPICVAVPATGSGRWLLDMATTTVAKNKLEHAAYLGWDTIPDWWGFIDAAGKPTTNLAAAQAGLPTAVGGYKGSGLAVMVEILTAGLSGGPMAEDMPQNRTGASDPVPVSHAFLAIAPDRFLAPGEFQTRMTRLTGMLKSSAPAPGYTEVLVAGEPEWRMQEKRQRDGIPIPTRLWARLGGMARPLGVVPPAPLAG